MRPKCSLQGVVSILVISGMLLGMILGPRVPVAHAQGGGETSPVPPVRLVPNREDPIRGWYDANNPNAFISDREGDSFAAEFAKDVLLALIPGGDIVDILGQLGRLLRGDKFDGLVLLLALIGLGLDLGYIDPAPVEEVANTFVGTLKGITKQLKRLIPPLQRTFRALVKDSLTNPRLGKLVKEAFEFAARNPRAQYAADRLLSHGVSKNGIAEFLQKSSKLEGKVDPNQLDDLLDSVTKSTAGNYRGYTLEIDVISEHIDEGADIRKVGRAFEDTSEGLIQVDIRYRRDGIIIAEEVKYRSGILSNSPKLRDQMRRYAQYVEDGNAQVARSVVDAEDVTEGFLAEATNYKIIVVDRAGKLLNPEVLQKIPGTIVRRLGY